MSSDDTDPAHDLMPEVMLPTMPPLYATENERDPVTRLKWFTSDANRSWFVTYAGPGITWLSSIPNSGSASDW